MGRVKSGGTRSSSTSGGDHRTSAAPFLTMLGRIYAIEYVLDGEEITRGYGSREELRVGMIIDVDGDRLRVAELRSPGSPVEADVKLEPMPDADPGPPHGDPLA